MAFATLNGIRVHYVIQGEGAPLLMFAPGGFRSVIS
ncbi:MAG: alpha/beta hydrolase, partial [Betaproteobacteria bacterium]